jgi:hypothetical protein
MSAHITADFSRYGLLGFAKGYPGTEPDRGSRYMYLLKTNAYPAGYRFTQAFIEGSSYIVGSTFLADSEFSLSTGVGFERILTIASQVLYVENGGLITDLWSLILYNKYDELVTYSRSIVPPAVNTTLVVGDQITIPSFDIIITQPN